MRAATIRALGVLAVGLFLLAGCGETGVERDASSTAEEGAAGDAPAEQAPAAPEGEPIDADAAIIYTAALAIVVDDPTDAADQVVAVATEREGTLESRTDGDEGDAVTVVVRVPAADFDDAVAAIAATGEVDSQEISAQEVTDQVVDLEGRLANAEASVDRLRALYEQAESVADVVAIEGELTAREEQVEVLTGQLRVLEDQVDRSTIRVTLEPEASESSDDLPGFLDGLRGGVRVLRDLAVLTLAAAGFVLPFLPIVVVVGLGIRFAVRRGRARRARRALPPE